MVYMVAKLHEIPSKATCKDLSKLFWTGFLYVPFNMSFKFIVDTIKLLINLSICLVVNLFFSEDSNINLIELNDSIIHFL